MPSALYGKSHGNDDIIRFSEAGRIFASNNRYERHWSREKQGNKGTLGIKSKV